MRFSDRRHGKAGRSFEPEDVVFRLLPQSLAGGTVTPLLAYCCFSLSGHFDAGALGIALYMALAMVLATWMGVLVLAIGCLGMRLAKGPARFADAYPLPDASRAKVGFPLR